MSQIQVIQSRVEDEIENLLLTIPEFEELNLSQHEYEGGVEVNDSSRPTFAFIDRYSEIPENDDSIDLSAAIRNICIELSRIIDDETDCFLCAHQDNGSPRSLSPGKDCDKEFCSNCKINKCLENNYSPIRTPKGKYTISCKTDCPVGFRIYCKECERKEECKFECDGDSDTCGNVHSRL